MKKIVFFLFFIFFSPILRGQDAGSWVALSSLNNYQGEEQDDVYVEGKFNKSYGESFYLYGTSMKFRISSRSPLYNFINGRAIPQTSNMRISGNILFNNQYKIWYFKVVNVRFLEEKDESFFLARIEEFKKNIDRLHDIAYQIRIISQKTGNSELLSSRRKALLLAIELELNQLDPKEFRKRYQLAKRLDKKYKLPIMAFKVYRECLTLEPGNAEISKRLKDLGGKFHQGKWMLEDEIKKLSGLVVSKKGEWLVKEKLFFLKFFKNYKKEKKLSKDSYFYMKGHKLQAGITPKKVHQLFHLWPKSVWRKYKNKLCFEQWNMEIWDKKKNKIDIYYLYFFNRKLVNVHQVQSNLQK